MQLASLLVPLLLGLASVQAKHTFKLGTEDFLLDGKPFTIMAGEMHPARIPPEYWRQRIQMAKAMGLNTLSCYVFWNFHEPEEGKYDFKSPDHDLARFFRIAQEEGMWVILRPGPYCCGEWDFGGIPSYLLKYPDLKVRCMDPRYTAAAGKYLAALAKVVKPQMVANGGPILMVQCENEYGSYGNDRAYMEWVRDQWIKNGIDGPFTTSDGATTYMLEAGSLPGAAVGLDPGESNDAYAVARKMNPGVPVFSSETYPGWLTHWGEKWARVGTDGIVGAVKWLLENKKGFSLYMVHGGTNFGWWAGANSGGHGYEPDVTSYDYDAPITEQGRATPKYMALRDLIAHETGQTPPAIPDPIPAVTVPPFEMKQWASVLEKLPKPIMSPQPKPFEALGQDHGFMLYRTRLIGHKSGHLDVKELHDFATVYVDGEFVGTMDRREGKMSIDLPASKSKEPVLDILVEGMGRINFASTMIDRKGITDRVTLNGMTLMDWECYPLPMDGPPVGSDIPARAAQPGHCFGGSFELAAPADTYLDMSQFKKGVVWVNGHNLGRYWEIGPQHRLYCPATWLKAGQNIVIVFDLLKTGNGEMRGFETLE